MEKRTVRDSSYIREYFPMGAFVLVEKDETPEMTKGGVILPDKHREENTNFTSTGVIVKKSAMPFLKTVEEQELNGLYRVGDRIGFTISTPLVSPAPPYYVFAGNTTEERKFVTLHIEDILCVLCDTAESRKEFKARFKRAR